MFAALVGGAAVLIGFFALPLIDLGVFGSYTALQLLTDLINATSTTTRNTTDSSSMVVLVLAFVVAAGALIALEAGIAWVSSGRSGMPPLTANRWVIAIPAIGGVIAGIITVIEVPDALSAIGGGFWLMAIGFVIALIGAFV